MKVDHMYENTPKPPANETGQHSAAEHRRGIPVGLEVRRRKGQTLLTAVDAETGRELQEVLEVEVEQDVGDAMYAAGPVATIKLRVQPLRGEAARQEQPEGERV